MSLLNSTSVLLCDGRVCITDKEPRSYSSPSPPLSAPASKKLVSYVTVCLRGESTSMQYQFLEFELQHLSIKVRYYHPPQEHSGELLKQAEPGVSCEDCGTLGRKEISFQHGWA